MKDKLQRAIETVNNDIQNIKDIEKQYATKDKALQMIE